MWGIRILFFLSSLLLRRLPEHHCPEDRGKAQGVVEAVLDGAVGALLLAALHRGVDLRRHELPLHLPTGRDGGHSNHIQ